MFQVQAPSRAAVAQLQETATAFYWSASAGMILRKHGLRVAAEGAAQADSAFPLVLRGVEGPLPDRGFIEGPLPEAWLRELGLAAVTASAEEVALSDADGVPLGQLVYSRFLVKRIPASRQEVTEPHEWIDPDPRWRSRPVAFQTFPVLPAGWRVVCQAETGSGKAAVMVSDGRRIVCGAPVFDILGHMHAMPALTEGFFKTLKTSYLYPFEKWLVRELAAHAGPAGAPGGVWPLGMTSALSIRHDYDRPISDAHLADMLRCYAGLGLRATWFLIVGKPPPRQQIESMLALGHEVALHSIANTLDEFIEEALRFRELTGTSAAGFTCHGGIGSSGHLALTHNLWAHGVGMRYGEMIGRCRGVSHPLVTPRPDIPAMLPLMLQNCHHSLDLTTKPDGHQLERLREEVPRALAEGGYVTVMNHPDIHWPEMRALMQGLDLHRVWTATLRDANEWLLQNLFTG
ncbi:hypothetical protein FN976_05145 [Caenimonas sedimenti]|uniref:NodB homology domain-containing protein n=1 Tax=Caenimonas sedimenti TaxID=2596921 RepID=A0A562ZVA5_9BURK|nr:hypothetical protein [Caenimonas sedimenti]TWO72104.1 hypothetical protein FN976_05145 [Caenimonas sedimenti]